MAAADRPWSTTLRSMVALICGTHPRLGVNSPTNVLCLNDYQLIFEFMDPANVIRCFTVLANVKQGFKWIPHLTPVYSANYLEIQQDGLVALKAHNHFGCVYSNKKLYLESFKYTFRVRFLIPHV